MQKINKKRIAFIVIYVFLSFILINLLSDALNLNDHTVLSLTSFAIFMTVAIFLMIKYPEVYTISFMK